MQQVTKIAGISAAMGVLAIAIAAMAGVFNEKMPAGTKALAEEYNGQTHTVSLQAVKSAEVVSGSVDAKFNTRVSSRVLAQLKTLHVRAGDTVSAGQLIATLEDADLKTQVQQVKAQQSANDAQLAQAKKQLERVVALKAQGLVAQNQVDEWQTKVNELEAQSAALVQQLEGTQVALGYTKIHAPIDGKVVERLQEPGTMLSPGMAIVSLYNPTKLQVHTPVREQQAAFLRVGDKLKVFVPAVGLTEYAQISEIVPVADKQARRFAIKLDIGFAKEVKPGMYAQVFLPGEEQITIVIPRKLVKRYGQLTMVEVVEQGQLQKRYVRLGEAVNNSDVQVLAGLEAGEKIALKPAI